MNWVSANREILRKVASHATLFFAGASVGSGFGLYTLNKYQARVNDRHKKIANTLEEAEGIMNDITLSGEDREKKAQELFECAVIMMREDLF
jgi:hypothetical protein